MRVAMLSVALSTLALAAVADPLPEGAKPMSSEQVRAIYSGHWASWSQSKAAFLADGTVKGQYNSGIWWGKWSVKKNELCTTGLQGYDKINKKSWSGNGDCWKWWVDSDGKPVTLWSKHYDGSKVDLKDGYYNDEIGKIKKGDKVSAGFDKVYAKLKP